MENRKWKFGRKLHGVFFEMGVIMAAVAYMMIASSFFILFSGQFPMLSAGRTANEAQALAELEANVLKLVSYDELDGAKHDRQAVKFDGWDGWESEVKIGDEMKVNNDDDSLQRIATVSIFKNDDTLSRYSMQIPLSDAAGGSGVPVGTIIMRPTDAFKTESERKKFLYCDGSKFDTTKYPKLYKILGTDTLPDLRERFPEGSSTQQNTANYLEAGLPNIYGSFTALRYYTGFLGSQEPTGVFQNIWSSFIRSAAYGSNFGHTVYNFDAKTCSNIYGNSNTVQPPAMTVNF